MDRDSLLKLRQQLDQALETGTPEDLAALHQGLAEALGQLWGAHPPSGAGEDELERILQVLEETWNQGLAPSGPLPGSPDLQARLSRLLDEVLAVQNFAIAVSKGNLSPLLKAKGLMSGGLKALQASLRHLTWQTQMIAKGDFSQRVDFMGEFSQSFNAMVHSLAEAREQLENREKLIQNLNRQLQQRVQELTTANQDLETFNYSVSHDLRAPLRAIVGFCRILQEDHAPRLDGEGLRLLKVIADNVQLMTQLIDDLLAFARSGRKSLEKSDIDMNRLTVSLGKELKGWAPGRNLDLTLKKLPPAHGDPALIKQALLNLLTNALKFTRPRAATIIEVGGWSEGEENIYYVKDNGVGFDMKDAEKLFAVFQRVHQREFEGTGVGLAIVQRIIQRHGGRTWAVGKVNEGATFSFSLPRFQHKRARL